MGWVRILIVTTETVRNWEEQNASSDGTVVPRIPEEIIYCYHNLCNTILIGFNEVQSANSYFGPNSYHQCSKIPGNIFVSIFRSLIFFYLFSNCSAVYKFNDIFCFYPYFIYYAISRTV